MGSWKAKQPRAKVMLCGVCDRQLYAGGRSYDLFVDEGGVERPAHKQCAATLPESQRRPTPGDRER